MVELVACANVHGLQPILFKRRKRMWFLKVKIFCENTRDFFLEGRRGLVGEGPERLVEGEVTKVCYTYVKNVTWHHSALFS